MKQTWNFCRFSRFLLALSCCRISRLNWNYDEQLWQSNDSSTK